jgi:hypothetical protein
MSTPAPGRHGVRSPQRVAVAVAIAVAIVAALAASAAVSDPAAVGAGPTTTAAPTTTRPGTTVAATTISPPTLPPPPDEASDPVRTLLPGVVAIAEQLVTDADRQPVVASALTERRNTVAIEAAPGTVCAVVPVAAPVMAAGRWEHDGEELASAELIRRDPPGYGDCITTDDVGDFDPGVYQYVAVGPTGATSAVATLVVGVPAVVVWLLNNGDEPVCLVQTSPSEADFYDAYQANSDLLPGEALAVRLAAVEHDVRVYGCPPDDVVRSLDVVPQVGVYVELFAVEAPGDSTPSPGGSTTSTTPRPTTTA